MWNCNVRVHKYRFPVAQLHCPWRLWHGNGRAGYPKHRLASKVYYLAPWGKSPLTPNREALVSVLRFVKMCASHGPEGGSHYLEKINTETSIILLSKVYLPTLESTHQLLKRPCISNLASREFPHPPHVPRRNYPSSHKPVWSYKDLIW